MPRYITEEFETPWIVIGGKPTPFSHAIYDTKDGGKRPIALAPSQAIALQLVRIINSSVETKKKKKVA